MRRRELREMKVMNAETQLDPCVSDPLRERFGERFLDTAGKIAQYGEDISHFAARPPDAVVFPENTKEVQEIVHLCAATRTPIIPFGVGSSVEGHILALQGGVTINMSRMDALLEVNAEDLDVRVQPGLTRKRLNEDLRDTGLFFPIDPGADASLGGMAATRASGTNAVRYGTMKSNVLGLEVVLPNGNVIRTAQRARKSSAGYDLTSLFVGSEGTLGIITELNLRVYGQPESIRVAVCPFESLKGAIESVIEVIQLGVPVARVELMDEATIDAVNAYSKTKIAREPTLFLEFHGSQVAVENQVATVETIMREHGAFDFQWAETTEDRNSLWDARHAAAHAISAFVPGASQWWSDVCVPISTLAECIEETKRDIEESGLYAPLLGHVGDGNFHLGISAPDGDMAAREKAEWLHHRLVQRAIAMDGTCTGEHGIGCGKIEYLREELGPTVDVMADIKSVIDPLGIMNPGKIFTSSSELAERRLT